MGRGMEGGGGGGGDAIERVGRSGRDRRETKTSRESTDRVYASCEPPPRMQQCVPIHLVIAPAGLERKTLGQNHKK